MAKKIRGYVNGKYLKELRIKNGYTPLQVAQKLGIGLSTYYKWEGNKQAPSILKMQLLQLVFGEMDYNKLLSLEKKKCYNDNCIDNGKEKHEVR